MEFYGHCLPPSYGEVGPRYRAAGVSNVYPLSSTVLPDHTLGDHGKLGVEGGGALDSGAREGIHQVCGSNSPDGKQPNMEQPCHNQSTLSSNSITLSPSDTTLNADELGTYSLTEVSLSSTLLALAQATEEQVPGTQALGGAMSVDMGRQQAGDARVQESGEGSGVQEENRCSVVQMKTEDLEFGIKSTEFQEIGKTMEDHSGNRNPKARGIGSWDMPSQPPSASSVLQISKEDICQIVRKEIKPMLQVSTCSHA